MVNLQTGLPEHVKEKFENLHLIGSFFNRMPASYFYLDITWTSCVEIPKATEGGNSEKMALASGGKAQESEFIEGSVIDY